MNPELINLKPEFISPEESASPPLSTVNEVHSLYLLTVVNRSAVLHFTCGIFPDQGSNPHPLHWQADSYPLRHQGSPFFFLIFIYLFIYLWPCWVFVSVRGLSLVAASGGHSLLRCAGLSPSRPLLLGSTGSRRAGSVIVAHGPSCSAARGILPDQGSNPCPLHWQADSQPLRHQGSPVLHFKSRIFCFPLSKNLQVSWNLLI